MQMTARENSMPGSGSSIRSPGSRRPCACVWRTSALSIWSASATPRQGLRWQQDLQGHPSAQYSCGAVLVTHGLRQPDPLDARHAAALSARRQPELSVTRRRTQRRWVDDGVLRTYAAGGRHTWELDPDDARSRLVDDHSPLQPAATVFRQELAPGRDRIGQVGLAVEEG